MSNNPNDATLMAYIKEQLEWHADFLEDELKSNLLKRRLIDTRELYNSVKGRVVEPSNGNLGSTEFTFLKVGRLIDMGAGRKASPFSIENNNENFDRKRKGRKPRKWYSKAAYWSLNPLLQRLQFGYTKSVRERIKKTIEQP